MNILKFYFNLPKDTDNELKGLKYNDFGVLVLCNVMFIFGGRRQFTLYYWYIS